MEIKEAGESGFYVSNLHSNQNLHSRINPYQESRELLPEKQPDHERFVIFGAGLGYILRELQNRCDQPRVLVFEPHPELLEEGRNRDIWDPDSFYQFFLVGPDESDLLEKLFRFLPLEVLDNFTTIQWEDYRTVEPNFFERMETQLRGLREHHRQNLASLWEMGNTWLKNIRDNLFHLYEHQVPDTFNFGGSVAVVGAGPSLDEQLDWLKKNKDRLTIFAINTAGSVLRKHDVHVDIHFAVDARNEIVLDLQDSTVNHAMVSPNVDPNVIQSHSDSFTFLGLLSPLSNWLQSAPFIPNIPSKSAGVPSIVKWLSRTNTDNIYLLGCDLGTRNGRFYARGTRREQVTIAGLNRFKTLPAWHLIDKAHDQKDQHWGQETWMNLQTSLSESLVVPEPAPGWWGGRTTNDPVQNKPNQLDFKHVQSTEVQEWVVSQQNQLEKLITNPHDAEDPWQQFWFWVHKLCSEPGNELRQWRELFQTLSDSNNEPS